MQHFLEDSSFDLLISSGFAGGVRDNLQIGDLLLSSNFSDERLLDSTQEILKDRSLHVAKLVTSKEMVDSAAARKNTARASGAAAVDMETEIIAEACAARGIPLLSLRVITDTSQAPLPVPPNVLFDVQRQRTNPASLASYVITHPAALGRLFRFSGQLRRARANLTSALTTLLQSDSLGNLL